ncbi:hypothetical protein EYF80_055825 [Liparis tanakae]|uniref:Uncharacterized protein n=1 Tax=Liparis tanakae TaxID=230148 RepID=A0A4Z2F0J3_9TELE|nr:hypothetical protein EYF80_055825 [Liparis tanakae]
MSTNTAHDSVSRDAALTSVNSLWFSACSTCVCFLAEAKGDWVMCVGAGGGARSGNDLLACWWAGEA